MTHIPNPFTDVIQFDPDNTAEIGKARLMVKITDKVMEARES